MSYYVTTQGRNNLTLFLVDRRFTKKQWWTTDLSLAIEFRKRSAAEYSCKRLRYKDPCVVDSRTANQIAAENLHIECELDEHPFSSEALGQD